MSAKDDKELSEEIGLLADQADNFVAAAEMQLPAHIHAECLRHGMKEIATKLHAIYERTQRG